MASSRFSQRMANAYQTMAPFLRFYNDSPRAERANMPGACDFAVGNPHDMPLPGYVEALQRWVVPQDQDWFAYKLSEEKPREVVAESLRQWRGVPFEASDIFLTTGAFAGLSVTLNSLADHGDEVIFLSPPWFFYEPMITATGAEPVRVKVAPGSFDLDLEAIQGAITPRTRAIIVNSPNNPTGRIYSREALDKLGQLLTDASERNGRPIYLISDESYSRIIFDGHGYHSPTSSYPNSFLIYTYGKTLLTPGQRIGYIALPPTMPDRETVRDVLTTCQFVTGFTFPNALLQHALADLDKLSIDIGHLEWKRDRLVEALRGAGYEVHKPDGTFYLLPRSPWQDDWAFCDLLAELDILALPGSTVECPGYFRLSLTANDEMIERSIPLFAQAMERARETAQAA